MLFVIPAFGGVVSWEGEGAPFKEDDQSITHKVCYITNRYTRYNIYGLEHTCIEFVEMCLSTIIHSEYLFYMFRLLTGPHWFVHPSPENMCNHNGCMIV